MNYNYRRGSTFTNTRTIFSLLVDWELKSVESRNLHSLVSYNSCLRISPNTLGEGVQPALYITCKHFCVSYPETVLFIEYGIVPMSFILYNSQII